MIKRFFDIIAAGTGLVILSPVLLFLCAAVTLDSKGGVFYRQIRVGKGNKDFKLFKFRTMQTGADKKGLLTVGGKDSRITRVGYILRKYKLDELPQLLNVIMGDMSLVGPRPEVRRYVDLYNSDQLRVLDVAPGITDYASIEYSNENEILGKAEDPEKVYISEIMPHKLSLNLKYIKEKSLMTDIKIIFRTIFRISKH